MIKFQCVRSAHTFFFSSGAGFCAVLSCSTKLTHLMCFKLYRWIPFCLAILFGMATFGASGEAARDGQFLKRPSNFAFDLKEIVSIGVFTNPEMVQAMNNKAAVAQQLEQARAGRRPTIDLFAGAGYEKTEDRFTRTGPGSDSETLFRRRVSLTVNQMLFDGFETQSEIDRQKAGSLVAHYQAMDTAEQIGLNIVQAYYNVVTQRKILEIARQNVSVHLDIFNQVRQSARAGRLSQTDIEQIKARLAAAKTSETSVREQLERSESDFKRLTGIFPQKLSPPVQPVAIKDLDVATNVEIALEDNPALKAVNKAVDARQARLKSAQAPFYPQIDLRLNARRADDVSGLDAREDSLSALIVMTWDLYSGGADTARSEEFLYRFEAAKDRFADRVREIEDLTRQSISRMISARAREDQFTAQARANERLVDAYMDQFQLGRRSLLDVLDVQSEYFVSSRNAVLAKSRQELAAFQILALQGRLLKTLGVAYDDFLGAY